MYVVHRLTSEVVAVHDDTEAVLAALLFGEALGRKQDMAGERLVVLLAEVMKGCDVLFRDDEKMHRRLRGDVVESDDLVIFIDLLRGNFPGHDPAEQTIHGVSPALYDKAV